MCGGWSGLGGCDECAGGEDGFFAYSVYHWELLECRYDVDGV